MASTDPRAATQAQWEDLVTRIKSKADVSAIPTVNNSTITITNNGSTVDSFTTNAASAKTIALSAPVITMTTTDPGAGSSLAANNFIGVYGGDPIIMDYSTSEINTGAKWIDDSAIYKKTISTGTLPNATEKNVAHNISNLSRVIKIEGYAYRSSDGKCIPVPFPGVVNSSTAGYSIDTSVVNGSIRIVSQMDFSGFTESYITLYYTKSS